jgi:hypothetical protein
MRLKSLVCFLTLLAPALHAEPLRIPAFTAYTLPDADGARISERGGVTRWLDPGQSVNWYGQFTNTGDLSVKLLVRLKDQQVSRLRLVLAGESRELQLTGTNQSPLTADFGSFKINQGGYQRFTLTSLNASGQPSGDLEALLLDGPAARGAHFNLKERRNAASVHLSYPIGTGTNVQAFYCEATAVEDPLWTFYMACGWHRGYFGMQVNSPTERRIIFSVWDSGNEGVDRNKVAAADRVTLVGKGEGVYSGDFGNEGTGGHSHLKFQWKTGEKQRFLITAKPADATHTIFSGYYLRPDKSEWMLISSWKAPKDGGWLRGLHSFSENFGGANGNLPRKALYGNQWFQTDKGQWLEMTRASFSHDPTGKADRLDRFMGVENGQFFLHHGGFVPGYTPYGEKFTRPATGKQPDDLPDLIRRLARE